VTPKTWTGTIVAKDRLKSAQLLGVSPATSQSADTVESIMTTAEETSQAVDNTNDAVLMINDQP
jgi:hypothetical protein